jgi:hypothetical protein
MMFSFFATALLISIGAFVAALIFVSLAPDNDDRTNHPRL